jgi:hypothetical protein
MESRARPEEKDPLPENSRCHKGGAIDAIDDADLDTVCGLQ